MNVISHDCCGGRFYELCGQQFSNPFIWSICPYKSIIKLLTHFYEINWNAISIHENKLKPHTYIITVDNQIDIHYVHYVYNVNATIVTSKTYSNGVGDVYYNKIWQYVVDKYKIRVKRMISNRELPSFIIRESNFANGNTMYDDLKQITEISSPFKRVIITKDKSISRNDALVKTIWCDNIMNTTDTILTYGKVISTFFNS